MAESDNKKLIAFVTYPGFTLLELVGAFHLLMASLMLKGYRVVAVGEKTEPVETDTPMKIIPQKTFSEVPQPYAIIVLGSQTRPLDALEDRTLIEYVRRAGESAELVAAISSGSLILAKAGLLKGKQATTHWAYAKQLENLGARYARRPYVEDGKVITAAGVSGAIDLGIYLAAKLAGENAARQAQITIEYDPQPPFGGIDWSQVNGAAPTEQKALPPSGEKKTIAMVIYQGLTVFDLVGPLQVYSALNRIDPRFRVVVVTERLEPIKTDLGITMIPTHTFDQVPQPDIFVVPGGDQPTIKAMSNPAIRKYILTANNTSDVTGSVCTGALILAGVGLLEGRPATTHWAYTKVLEQFGAQYQHQRWVEDGKLFMSAGVSAGIEASLALTARLTDEDTARRVQLAIQYDPHPPFGRIDWDRLSFALRLARGFTGLMAPYFAAKPKRLTRQDKQALRS